jgi:hypothetical protein
VIAHPMLLELDQVPDDTALPIQQQLPIHQTVVPILRVEQEELLVHHAWASGTRHLGVGAGKGTLQVCCQLRI